MKDFGQTVGFMKHINNLRITSVKCIQTNTEHELLANGFYLG